VVADVGSGTGILTRALLETGAKVFGVEPNREMREAAERLLKESPRFQSVAGTAEATTLPDSSVDLIAAGQSFHWFDVQKTRAECLRVLKSDGWVALVWNERPPDATPFLAEYEELLRRHAAEYQQIKAQQDNDGRIREFFDGSQLLATFSNHQIFDFEGLAGRLMSSSYAPEAGHPEHGPMMAALRDLFDRHQQEGQVVFPYETRVFYGRLK
jgi:ubiquinone/menaquinone biosynthesis C-methylase UbiE